MSIFHDCVKFRGVQSNFSCVHGLARAGCGLESRRMRLLRTPIGEAV